MVAWRGKQNTLPLPRHLLHWNSLGARRNFSLWGKFKQESLSIPSHHCRHMHTLLQENSIVLTGPEPNLGSYLEFTCLHCSRVGAQVVHLPSPVIQAAMEQHHLETRPTIRVGPDVRVRSHCISPSLRFHHHSTMLT